MEVILRFSITLRASLASTCGADCLRILGHGAPALISRVAPRCFFHQAAQIAVGDDSGQAPSACSTVVIPGPFRSFRETHRALSFFGNARHRFACVHQVFHAKHFSQAPADAAPRNHRGEIHGVPAMLRLAHRLRHCDGGACCWRKVQGAGFLTYAYVQRYVTGFP